jgi:hypothetical protein
MSEFIFRNLDDSTRAYMLKEIGADDASGKIYPSKRFNETGEKKYTEFLKQTVQTGTESTLANLLRTRNCFKELETKTVKGKPIQAKVPSNAAEVFAEGEFNRYYLRGLCLRAIEEGVMIEIYRARESITPRELSSGLIGKLIDPQSLLSDLRENTGVDTALGLPPGPNSGLSGKLTPKPI